MSFDGIATRALLADIVSGMASWLRRTPPRQAELRVVRVKSPSLDEHEFEPVPGLPARLPKGEELLWQGTPSAKAMALEVFHVRKVAAYFVVLFSADAAHVGLTQGASAIAAALGPGAGLALLAIAILSTLAILSARSCIYSITSRRVVMRYGVVLPMVMNIPFSQVASADLHLRAGGEGDVALRLLGPGRIAYFALWPHARPWRLRHPQPLLRCVPGVETAAQVLARALADAARVRGTRAVPAQPAGMVPAAA